jgi:hypothetical protein
MRLEASAFIQVNGGEGARHKQSQTRRFSDLLSGVARSDTPTYTPTRNYDRAADEQIGDGDGFTLMDTLVDERSSSWLENMEQRGGSARHA